MICVWIFVVVLCLSFLPGNVISLTFERDIKDFDPTTCEPKYGFHEKGIAINNYDKNKNEWVNMLSKTNGLLSRIFGNLERFGELGSWASALVFIGAGITNVVSIVSPGVGLFSWIAGLVVQYQNNKEKDEFVRNLQGALASISNDMSLRFEHMKHYVDESTIDFEKSVLGGEFHHMYEYLSECMEIDERPVRSHCLVDRCSYVRAGFKKFAIYYDELSLKYKETVQPYHFSLKKWKSQIKKMYKKLTVLQVKRIQANMPMFASYVQSLLIPCETVKIFEGVLTVLGTRKKQQSRSHRKYRLVMDEFKEMKQSPDNSKKWRLKDMIYNYMNNANQVILAGYEDYSHWMKDDAENPRKVVAYGGDKFKKKDSIYLKCRMRMNPMNLDTCDMEDEIPYKEYKNGKTQYHGNIDAMLKDYCLQWSWDKADVYRKYYEKVEKKIQQNDQWHKLAKKFREKLDTLYKNARNTRIPN